MNIILHRTRTHNGSSDGTLAISGQHVCDCSEFAGSCLPLGTYPIVVSRCKQYNRKMPLVLMSGGAMPDCSRCPKLRGVSLNSRMPVVCPMLKPGNGVNKRNDGSIIVGERLCQGVMLHPAVSFNRLIDRLDKAQLRGEPIELTVVKAEP